MAKASKVPTYDEMLEYNKVYKADPIHNSIRDLDHITMVKDFPDLAQFKTDLESI